MEDLRQHLELVKFQTWWQSGLCSCCLVPACGTSDLQLQLCQFLLLYCFNAQGPLGRLNVMPQLYIYMAFKIRWSVLEICFDFPWVLANFKLVTLPLQPSKHYRVTTLYLPYFRAFKTACLTCFRGCLLGDKFSGSPYIAQADLKLLGLNDPTALSSWVLGVGISHHARLWLAYCLLRLLW